MPFKKLKSKQGKCGKTKVLFVAGAKREKMKKKRRKRSEVLGGHKTTFFKRALLSTIGL